MPLHGGANPLSTAEGVTACWFFSNQHVTQSSISLLKQWHKVWTRAALERVQARGLTFSFLYSLGASPGMEALPLLADSFALTQGCRGFPSRRLTPVTEPCGERETTVQRREEGLRRNIQKKNYTADIDCNCMRWQLEEEASRLAVTKEIVY